jgi:hypothetical protein
LSIKSRTFALGSVILCTGSWSCPSPNASLLYNRHSSPRPPPRSSPRAAAFPLNCRPSAVLHLPAGAIAGPANLVWLRATGVGRLAQLTDSLALCLDDQLGRRTVVTLRGAACQVRQLPVDQVPIPLHVGAETSHSRGSDHLINLFGGYDTSLARRHHLHDVGAQTACCLRQLHTSVVVVSQRLPSLRGCVTIGFSPPS